MRTFTKLAVGLALSIVPVLALAGPAQAATAAALWHMQETGSLVDSSGQGNGGTTKSITGVTGSSGKGYHFNGKSSVATVPDDSSLDSGTATLTITAHVRFTVAPSRAVGDYDLVRKGVAGTKGGDWKMEIYPPSAGSSSGPAFCLFQDANKKTASIRGTRNLADGAWHTVTCQRTSNAIKLTVDGATQTKSVTLGSISNAQPVTIGAKPGGGDWFLGDMDEVSISVG